MQEAVEQPDTNLTLSRVRLVSFRNYTDFELRDLGPLTILIGPNAIGKTSIIEGIQLITALQSFRTSKNQQTVSWDSNSATIQGTFTGGGRLLDMELHIEEGKRKYSLNGKNKQIQDLKGLAPSVLFCPDNLNLVKGTQSIKRNEVDLLGSQISKNYYVVKRDYEKIIRQKNQLLKDSTDEAFLSGINDVVVAVGSQLLTYRLTVIEKIKNVFQDLYTHITGNEEVVDISYIPSWDKEDTDIFTDYEIDTRGIKSTFESCLIQATHEELARKRSVYGPQCDRIDFYINTRNAASYASQGQQRSLVLAFKLAQMQVIRDELHQRPLLLLDDVMSELDSRRRDAFIEFINKDIQTFITTTNIDYFTGDLLSSADVIHLKAESK